VNHLFFPQLDRAAVEGNGSIFLLCLLMLSDHTTPITYRVTCFAGMTIEVYQVQRRRETRKRLRAPTSSCANCGRAEEFKAIPKVCSARMLVKYCSRECQIAHRPQHKKACKNRAAERSVVQAATLRRRLPNLLFAVT
jgi:hypothetical protein